MTPEQRDNPQSPEKPAIDASGGSASRSPTEAGGPAVVSAGGPAVVSAGGPAVDDCERYVLEDYFPDILPAYLPFDPVERTATLDFQDRQGVRCTIAAQEIVSCFLAMEQRRAVPPLCAEWHSLIPDDLRPETMLARRATGKRSDAVPQERRGNPPGASTATPCPEGRQSRPGTAGKPATGKPGGSPAVCAAVPRPGTDTGIYPARFIGLETHPAGSHCKVCDGWCHGIFLTPVTQHRIEAWCIIAAMRQLAINTAAPLLPRSWERTLGHHDTYFGHRAIRTLSIMEYGHFEVGADYSDLPTEFPGPCQECANPTVLADLLKAGPSATVLPPVHATQPAVHAAILVADTGGGPAFDGSRRWHRCLEPVSDIVDHVDDAGNTLNECLFSPGMATQDVPYEQVVLTAHGAGLRDFVVAHADLIIGMLAEDTGIIADRALVEKIFATFFDRLIYLEQNITHGNVPWLLMWTCSPTLHDLDGVMVRPGCETSEEILRCDRNDIRLGPDHRLPTRADTGKRSDAVPGRATKSPEGKPGGSPAGGEPLKFSMSPRLIPGGSHGMRRDTVEFVIHGGSPAGIKGGSSTGIKGGDSAENNDTCPSCRKTAASSGKHEDGGRLCRHSGYGGAQGKRSAAVPVNGGRPAGLACGETDIILEKTILVRAAEFRRRVARRKAPTDKGQCIIDIARKELTRHIAEHPRLEVSRWPW